MTLLPGKNFIADTNCLIYESGDDVSTISYIVKGSVIVSGQLGEYTLKEGDFVAYKDIYSGFYSADYTATAGTELIPLVADSPDSLVNFLNANGPLHSQICLDVCKLISHFHDMYESLYNEVVDLYMNIDSTRERYIQCCDDAGIQPENFIMPHDTAPYAFAGQSYAKNYNIMASLVGSREKAAAVYKANGTKFLLIQTNLIKNIFTTYDDMAFYLRSMLTMFVGKSDNCLFAIVARLCQKLKNSGSIMYLLEDMRATVSNTDMCVRDNTGISLDIDYNRVDLFFSMTSAADSNNDYGSSFDDEDDEWDYSPDDEDIDYSMDDDDEEDEAPAKSSSTEAACISDLSNMLKQLCDFAELPDRYADINNYVQKFMSLSDKDSRDDDVRIFRKQMTEAYFQLYEEVFIHYAKAGERNPVIELFLDFGLMDERLLTDAQLEFICGIEPLNKTAPCKVYRMKDWLMRIYKGQEIPSKNEFDMEYVDHVREIKKNEALTPDQERKLLTDNELKTRYEIKNMLKYNCRLLNGNLLGFFPMLHMGNFERGIEQMLLTSEIVNEQISKLLEIDFSIFYREMLFADPEKKIEKESIQKEIFPNIILFPVAGINSIMWQEISGKRSNSEGRIFFPAFFEGKLEDTLLNIFAKYHWELCKTIQGGAWNNIAVPSLTSEYSDYIQFYRRNRELSAEKKELLKNQISRYRNNMREIFASDYVTWMKYESTGSIRLNKIARRVLATYCPFKKDIRNRLQSQPIFEEAMHKFERERQKKCKEITLRFKALEKKGAEFTKELTDTQAYYEEL